MDATTAWLHLALAPGLGPGRVFADDPDPDPVALVSDPPPAWRAALDQVDPGAVAAAREWAEAPGQSLLHPAHPDYPPLLRELPDPPLVLWVRGEAALLSLPQVAIVGSRHPTRDGMRNARAFGAHLAEAGFVITSGLAAGIDTAAHLGALDVAGGTVAVMGTGIDRIYPARNRGLAHRIVAEGGALVTEFPPGTPPRGGHFPRRNRILSGLALGTLVVEAALQSGSLITARLALEQGREVFAVPGSIHNPLARGCHRLIRQGAKLVETGQDIVEELGPLLEGLASRIQAAAPPVAPAGPADAPPNLTDEQRQLLELIGYDPVSVDDLVASTGLTPEALSSMLLILELEGCVVAHPGGRYARV
ncbi:MAG: DNA-protecting protein DprA [Gammaproteobacteria bacterium]|nr:MAG: DNA-protecting protein DprA [Gammaproteobacteria bacterium]